MSDFNYFDEITTGNTQKWISYLNKNYINTYAPTVRVFKLDKVATELDPLYNEATSARIYLPPLEIRAFHIDNKWMQMVGEGTMPYLEPEEDIQFVLNFEDMVQKVRELKNTHISDISIEYSGNGNPTMIKSGNTLTVKVDDIAVGTYDLTNTLYNTTSKLSSVINALTDFTVISSGENDSSINIVSFAETRFKHSTLVIYSPDHTYENCTDIFEKGDVVLTHKWHLYEIFTNLPGGDFGWDYATFVLGCNTKNLDEVILPSDFNQQIARHEYGLRDKLNME